MKLDRQKLCLNMPAFLVDTNASFGQDCIDIEQIIIKGVFVKDNEVKIIFTRFNADKMSERTDYESFENVFTVMALVSRKIADKISAINKSISILYHTFAYFSRLDRLEKSPQAEGIFESQRFLFASFSDSFFQDIDTMIELRLLSFIDVETNAADNTGSTDYSWEAIVGVAIWIIVTNRQDATFIIKDTVRNHSKAATDTIIGGTLLFNNEIGLFAGIVFNLVEVFAAQQVCNLLAANISAAPECEFTIAMLANLVGMHILWMNMQSLRDAVAET